MHVHAVDSISLHVWVAVGGCVDTTWVWHLAAMVQATRLRTTLRVTCKQRHNIRARSMNWQQ